MKKLFALALLPIFALSGCYGLSECSYEEFKEAGDKALEKVKEIDYVTYKGTYGDQKYNFKSNQDAISYSADELLIEGLLSSLEKVSDAYSFRLDSSTKFYKTFGFKVETSSNTLEYNLKGLLSSASGKLSGNTFDFKITYKFVK